MSIACGLLLVNASCSNTGQQKEENEVADSLETVRSIASGDSALIYKSSTNNWIASSVQSNIDWSRFHLEDFWSDDSLNKRPYTPEHDFYKDYAQLLKWSPDSNYVLDLGSYGVAIVKDKNGKPKIESGDVDTEVALVDPKSKTRTRLLFFGPSTTVVDGRWLDSAQVAILGLNHEKPNEQPDTVLWVIDVKEKFFRKYKWE